MGGAVTPARRAAYEVLRRCFEHGAWADRALPAALERAGVGERERAQAQWLAYGAVQRRGTSDALIKRLSGRKPGSLDAPVLAALRLGLYEVLYGRDGAHAAVDGAVELAKGGMGRRGSRRAEAAAGFVNALLRRATREREQLLGSLGDATPAEAAIAHSVPLWLAELWWRELGAEEARSLLRACNEQLETGLRVNTLRAVPAELRARLEAEGCRLPAPPERPDPLWPPEALAVRGALPEPITRRLESGELLPQSRAAQAAVALLDPRPGERVLDLCAGPGLKTTAIAARLRGQGEAVAVERDADRAAQIEEFCRRAGAENVRVVHADARNAAVGRGYDRVLVDPPCSDLGALASRPDARWRKDPAAIDELAQLQGELLAAGAAALARGGTLVYSTCTISRRENEDVVAAALAEGGLVADELGAQAPALASPHDPRFLQSRPDRDGTDGFFYARLRHA